MHGHPLVGHEKYMREGGEREEEEESRALHTPLYIPKWEKIWQAQP